MSERTFTVHKYAFTMFGRTFALSDVIEESYARFIPGWSILAASEGT